MAFGLDSSGFTKKSLADIKTEIEEELTSEFGPVNTAPDSVFGQLIGVFSEAISDLWDLAELVYQSQYPSSAIGVALDNVAELSNLIRLEATPSLVTAIAEGDEGTIIPIGTQFSQQGTNELFASTILTTITKADVLKTVISINTESSPPYTVTIDHTTTDIYTSSLSTISGIFNDLETQISASGTHTAVFDSAGETLTITSNDGSSPFEITVTSNMDIDEIWTPIPLEAVNPGSIEVPAGSINSINTPVAGLNSVDNILPGTVGRDTETDDEFRLRRKQSLRVVGAATIPAMEARILQEVEGVTSVIIVDNRTDLVDTDGRPPHSFEALIVGGVDQDIIDKIWEVKPAGIQTFGSESGQVTDSQGFLQTLFFSRPVNKYVHLEIDISLYSEEVFPANGIDGIKEAIVEFGNNLSPGDDILFQRFFEAIFSVPGVESINTYKQAVTLNPGDSVSLLISSSATSVVSGKLVDTGATFITSGVITGMVVLNSSDNKFASVVKVDSETELTLSVDIFDNTGDSYQIQVFGQVNIPLSLREIADFDTSRIDVTIT